MSGVESRSRLEQLEALQRRTHHQIQTATLGGDRAQLARLRQLDEKLIGEITALGGGKPKPARVAEPSTKRRKAQIRADRRVERLGVTTHDIRLWALEQGLIDRITRGRIKTELIEAYANHHRKETTP